MGQRIRTWDQLHPKTHIVASVPNNGTRSLKAILEIPEHVHFDWNFTDDLLKDFDIIHLPIRNPYAVAHSWARSHSLAGVGPMLECYDAMFRWLKNNEHRVFVHIVENFQTREGSAPYKEMDSDVLREWRLFMQERIVLPHLAWFKRWYPRLDPTAAP